MTFGAEPEAPDLILVLSDLHLGQGRDPITDRYDRRENFFAGQSFRAFLEFHDPAKHRPALLVLNGDTFDFLRVTSYPQSEEDFRRWSLRLSDLGAPRPREELANIARKEREYGLLTDDYKSVWKMLEIERGHPDFFDALRWWLEQGGMLEFLKGNHDLELHWPLVQASIRYGIGAASPQVSLEQQVRFTDTSMRVDNVYIEHGHRFERTTAVQGDPVLGDGHELNYPYGSFVNLYIINKLERIEPFLDNTKPVQKMIRAVIRKHPVKILSLVRRSFPLLIQSIQRRWLLEVGIILLYLLSLAVMVTTAVLIVYALASPAFAAKAQARFRGLQQLASVVGVLLPWIVAGIRDVLPRRRPKVGDDEYAEGVHAALRTQDLAGFARFYAVLGHTHRPDVQRLPDIGATQVYYLNSGTWAPIWDELRPDLIGRTILSFIRFNREGGAYSHQSLEWCPAQKPFVEAMILAPLE